MSGKTTALIGKRFTKISKFVKLTINFLINLKENFSYFHIKCYHDSKLYHNKSHDIFDLYSRKINRYDHVIIKFIFFVLASFYH